MERLWQHRYSKPVLDNWSHMHYMVYLRDDQSQFTAGSRVFIFKNSASDPIVKSYLRLLFNDNPADNANVITCSPSLSNSLRKGRADDQRRILFQRTIRRPHRCIHVYREPSSYKIFWCSFNRQYEQCQYVSFISNLKMTGWSGNDNLANVANYKCYVDSGYKYEDQNRNDYLSGPAVPKSQECAI